MNDKIKVVIKLRPLLEGEKDSSFSHWGVKGSTIFQIDPATRKLKNDCFTFDHIFDQSSTNQQIFSTVVKPIVDAAIQGFNGTIFAYGQTSSGKTHTMTGTLMQPGIIPTAIKYMFSSLEMDKKREFLLRVSYLEIYNEKVNDLLGNTQNIILREDGNGQITVGAEERVCNCVEKVLENKAVGEKNRRIGETNMNERSSRSHTIFRVILESSIKRTTSTSEEEKEDEGFVKISQLNLVDLAGSERAGQSGITGDRFKEGCHINSSLTTLGLVIKQLGDGNEGQHISFRDSKLTRLLKPSLGGNALTVIICTVTPTVIDQTLNTLNFALRAKKVKNKPELNEASDDAALIKRYRKTIAILNQKLENTKKRTVSTEELEIEAKRQDLLKQEKRIAKMKEDLINSGVPDLSKNNQALGRSKRRRTWGGQLESSLLLPMRVQLSTIKENSMTSLSQCNSISADNISETEVTESHRTRIFAQDIGKGNGDVGLFKDPGLCGVIKPISPETPPRVLRERIRSEADRAKSLETEYIQLKEFTTLEKQMFHTDGRKFEEDNEALNEKLFNALSSITELTRDKEQLENQLEEQISTVQKLKCKLIDIEVIKENTEKKFAERENELRKSLDEAWDNLRQKDATINYLKENIDQLQSNLRVCVDNSGASSLIEQNKILQQKLNDFMKIDKKEKNLEFQGSLLTPLADQIALKETEIQNQNILLAQRAKIHEEENQHLMSQVEMLETKLKELGWTSEYENKYQQQNLLLTKEIEIKDKEIKTLVSMNESLVTNLKKLKIITKCKNSNKNLLAEEVENKDEKINLLISSNDILEINQFDSISGNENEIVGEVHQFITLIEYKDQEVSNLKTHNLQLQNDLKRLQFIAEHENKLQERILELTDELESKREDTLNLNNHSENLGISSDNSLDNQEQVVYVIDKNQLDKANCTQISQYNISEKYDNSVMQDNIEYIPCDESLLFKDTLSQTVNNDPLQSFSSELDMNIENRTAIHEENFLLIEPNIQLENKLCYVSPLQQENTELLNKMYELERILENSTQIQEKNIALAEKLTLLKSKAENVSTIQEVNIRLTNKAKELELILENSNTIQKENIALSENIKILETKVEHISSLQENKDLIQKKKKIEQQLERSKLIDEENLMLLEKIKVIDTNLKDMFILQQKNKELSKNQIEHLERHFENNIRIQNKDIELKDKYKLLESNVDRVSTIQQENKELINKLEELERNSESIITIQNENIKLKESLKLMVSNLSDVSPFKQENIKLINQLEELVIKSENITIIENENIKLKERLILLDSNANHATNLQQENRELANEIEDMKKNLENINAILNENVKLKDKLTLLHSNVDHASCLQQENNELSHKIDGLERNAENIIIIQKENVELKERLALLHSTLCHASALQQENRDLSKTIEEMETNLESICELQKKNIQLKEKLDSNEDHASTLQQENKELTNKLEELERNSENINTIQNENVKLKERLKLMVSNLNDVSALKQENIKLTNKLEELEIKSENIILVENENIKLKERLILLDSNANHASNLKQENQKLANEIEDMEKNLENINAIQNENVILKEKLTLLHSNVDHASSLQQENNDLSHKIDGLERNTENIITIQKENVELKESLALLHSTLCHASALQHENRDLSKTIEEMETNLESISGLQKKNIQLKEKLDSIEDHASTLQQENKELTNKLEELERSSENINTIQNENVKLKERLKLMVSNLNDVSALKQENIKLTNKLEELEIKSENIILVENENIKLKERLILLDSNANHASNLKQENRKLAIEIEDMEKDLENINAIQNENVILKEKLTLLHSNVDHASSLQQENNELSHKIDGLERNTENIITIQKENVELKENLALLHSTLCHASALQQENRDLSKTIEEMETNLESISGLQKENIQLKEKLDSIEDHASTLQKENNELTNKLEELERNSENINTIQNQNVKLKERLKLMVSNLNDVSALKQENMKLTNKLEELEIKSENIILIENENIKLKEKLILLNSNANHASNLKQGNQKLANEIEDMEKDLENINAIQNENVILKEKLTLLHSNVDHASSLQQENNELSHKIDGLERNTENIITIQKENVELKENLALLHSTLCHASELQQENRDLSKTIEEMETNLESISELPKRNIELKEKLDSNEYHPSAIQNENIKLKETPISLEDNVENVSTLPQGNRELSNKSQKLDITLDSIHPVKEENFGILESVTECASMLQVLNIVEEQPKYSEGNDQISLSRIKELEKTISQLTKRNITLFESVQNSDLLKGKLITEILSLDPNITDKLHKFKNTELFDKLMYVLLLKEEEILSKFQDSCEAKVKDAQEINKQLEVEMNRLREWITEIENENERLSKELATILSDHEHIQSQLKRKNNEIKEKDDKLAFIENKILILQEESLNCYTELNAIQKEHKLCKIPEHFNEKLKKLQDDLKTKDILVKIQDEKVNWLTIKEIELSRSLEAEEKKNKELSDSITDQSKELKILELFCKRSKDELNAKNDEINCLISEIRLKEDKWKLCVCQQKENLTKSQCQSVIDEYKELLFHLKDHPHGIIKKLNSIADNFKLLKSVIELFKEKIEQEQLVSMKQIKDLETNLAEKDKICQELQSNINNLTKINTNNNKLVEDLKIKDDNLKTVIKNLEEKTKECSVVLLKLEEVENTLDAKNVENNKSREIYVKTCKELQNLKTAYTKEKDQNNNLTEKIESLLLQVNTLNNKNEIVEEQLDMLKCELNKNEDFFQKVGKVLQRSPSSLSEVLFIITEKMIYINELQDKLEVIQNVNKKLNTDYISLKTEIIQRDEELGVVLQREETLKEQYQKLKMQISTQINSDLDSNSRSVNEFESHLFNIIPGNPTSISEAFCIISNVFKEVEHLKSNVELMQEEKDNLDKECDLMNDLLKGTEQDLLNIQRQCSEYASDVTVLKAQIIETNIKPTLQEKVKHSETLLQDNDELKLEVSRYGNTIHNANKKVNTECDFLYTEKRDKELSVVLQREESLKEQHPKLKTQINTNIHPNDGDLNLESQLFNIIPGKPTSLSEAFCLISKVFEEVEHLKDNIAIIQEEKDVLDKECDMMNGLIKDTEKDLFCALHKCSDYASDITDLKNQITETKQSLLEKVKLSETLLKDNDALKLEVSVYENVIREHRKEKGKMILQISEYKNKIKTCDIELQQLKLQENHLNDQILNMTEFYKNAIRSSSSVECHCEEFKNKITELTINVADRNAKITALELQIQSDNVPLKKHVADLENSLEQAKEKIKELKSDICHYQMLSQETSLRDCEICCRRIERQVHTSVQTTNETSVPSTSSSCFEVQGTIEDKKYFKYKKEIDMLKRILWLRNKRIEELEKELNNGNVLE